jgi:hypothetical protein
MRKTKIDTWVVYRVTNTKKNLESNAICTQDEWDQIEISSPGLHTLVQTGIESESVAEKLARGNSGDPIVRKARHEPRA